MPGEAIIRGDARSFRPEVSAAIEAEMRRIAEGTAASYALTVTTTYTREFVPLVNDPHLTDEMLAAAGTALGEPNVRLASEPGTGSEDFARFLTHVPGCFAFIGNGKSAPLHNPDYDFDDAGLIHGAQVHAAIARRRLPVG